MRSKLNGLLGFALVTALVLAVVQWRRNRGLEVENDRLRSVVELAHTEAESSPRADTDAATTSQTGQEKLELMRLRNEVRELRERTKGLQNQKTAASPKLPIAGTSQEQEKALGTNAPGFVPKESWAFAGYASPEATFQSYSYSLANGELPGYLASLTPERQQAFQANSKPTAADEFAARAKRGEAQIAGYRIVGREPSSTDDSVILAIEIYSPDGNTTQRPIAFERVGQEWRINDGKQR